MNRDNALMLEAMHHHGADRIITSELHKVHTILNQLSTMIHLNRSSETDQLLSKIRDAAEMLMMDSPAEDAEDRSVQAGGSIEDITDAQKQSMDLLKQHGFHVNKVSNAHAEQQGGPVVYMGKKTGVMHQVAEVDAHGMINEETPEEYVKNHVHAEDAEAAHVSKRGINKFHAKLDTLVHDTFGKRKSENAEAAKQPYNAMTHLTQAANHIRHILRDNADDEAQVEHIIRMAQIILGDKKDYTDAEYRKMLDGLIVILNRFIIVPMNG